MKDLHFFILLTLFEFLFLTGGINRNFWMLSSYHYIIFNVDKSHKINK